MWIPPTIPELVLRVYTWKDTPEVAEAKKTAGVILSSDTTWDDELPSATGTLSSFCIKKLAKSYPDMVAKIEERNKNYRMEYRKAREVWKKAWKEYRRDRREFDQIIEEQEQEHRRFSFDLTEDYMMDRGLSFTGLDSNWKPPPLEPTMPPMDPGQLHKVSPLMIHLSSWDRIRLIHELDPDTIPVDMALRTIPDELYWKPLAEKKYPDAFVEQYGKSWKRIFVERNLRDAIEFFHPFEGKWEDLEKQLKIFGPFAKGLDLHHLVPICYGVPRKQVIADDFEADSEMVGAPEDEGFLGSAYLKRKKIEEEEQKALLLQKQREAEENEDNEEEDADKEPPKDPRDDNSHIDLSLILPRLKRLRYLSIMYKMQEAGLEFEPRFQEFTETDCRNLAKGLKHSYQLRKFELQRSHVTDEFTKILCRNAFRYMHHLKILNLSYNELGNDGAKAITKLLVDDRTGLPGTLHTLNLTSCEITRRGAKYLAYALSANKHLRKLSMRLNSIHDTGCRAFANALMENTSLLFLDMSATAMGTTGCYQFAKMLFHNEKLRSLNISSNPNIGPKAFGLMAVAVQQSIKLYNLDYRYCGTIDESLNMAMRDKLFQNVVECKRFRYPHQYKRFVKREARYAKTTRFHRRRRPKQPVEVEPAPTEAEGTEVKVIDPTLPLPPPPLPKLEGGAKPESPPIPDEAKPASPPTTEGEAKPASPPVVEGGAKPVAEEGVQAAAPITEGGATAAAPPEGGSTPAPPEAGATAEATEPRKVTPPEKSKLRKKPKPFEMEKRRLRYLMKHHHKGDRTTDSVLTGDRLDKLIAYLEDKTTVKKKVFRRRHKRHRWVTKAKLADDRAPEHHRVLFMD